MSQTPPYSRQEINDRGMLPQQLRDSIPPKVEQMWRYEFPALEQELFIAVCEISMDNPAVFRAFGCFRTLGKTNWQMTSHSRTNHEPGSTLNDIVTPFFSRIN